MAFFSALFRAEGRFWVKVPALAQRSRGRGISPPGPQNHVHVQASETLEARGGDSSTRFAPRNDGEQVGALIPRKLWLRNAQLI